MYSSLLFVPLAELHIFFNYAEYKLFTAFILCFCAGIGKQLSAGEYRLQVSYMFHDSGKYETAAARFTVTRIEQTTARTPEESAAINRLGEDGVRRFPRMKGTTNELLFQAFAHLTTYAKFKDAVVKSDEIKATSDGTKTVTLETDKGTYIAKLHEDGSFISDNQ